MWGDRLALALTLAGSVAGSSYAAPAQSANEPAPHADTSAILPFSKWMHRSFMTFDIAGKLRSCGVEISGEREQSEDPDCRSSGPRQISSNIMSRLGTPASKLVTEIQLIPGDPEPRSFPPLGEGEWLISRQVMELAVGADGRITGCRETLQAKLDGCRFVTARFEPPRNAAGTPSAARATMIVTTFAQKGPNADEQPRFVGVPQLVRGAPLFNYDDYPAEALDAGQQGSVLAKMRIDRRGKVAGCVVEESSGSKSLDAQTCKLLSERAKFEPARDASGKAVQSEAYQRINWRLEESKTPVEAWATRIVLSFTPQGELAACRYEMEGAAGGAPSSCMEEGQQIAQARRAAGLPHSAAVLVLEQRFVPRELTSAELGESHAQTLISRYVLKLSIGADGTVSDCRLVQSLGEQHPLSLMCESARGPFEAPTDAQGNPVPIVGTMMFSVSVRSEIVT